MPPRNEQEREDERRRWENQNDFNRSILERIHELEKDSAVMSTKWGFISAGAGIVATLVVNYLKH